MIDVVNANEFLDAAITAEVEQRRIDDAKARR
jgi:hypothetical protein